MNVRQLQYAIALSQDRSFSLVAEKLHISQPALSKQILSLEKELGVKLFDRNSNPLTLTPAGEYFIPQARQLLYKEDQLLRSMEHFKTGEAGQLTIGITPFRSAYLVSDMVKKVREAFPNVRVRLCEEKSEVLRREAVEGKYDFAIVNLPVEDSVLDICPLEPDQLVLAVPANLRHFLPAGTDRIDIAQCGALPFAVVSKKQEMRRLFDRLCSAADFQPNIAVEVVSLTTAWTMAQSGVAATILPRQFVDLGTGREQLYFIHIRGAADSRQPVIVTRRGQYLSEAAKYAIRILTEKT